MRTVSVLADDLTGATDSVVQFRAAGWESYLLLADALPGEVGDGAEALAVARSLDTRALASERAAQVTTAAVTAQLESGASRLYLKIDSTMRGSVDGQVAGALSAWSVDHPGAILVVCPAYPPMGRVVRDGRVFVNGIPLEQTPAGTDPVTPVRTSVIAELVPGAVAVGQADTPEALAASLLEAAPAGGPVVVDAESDQDLRRVALAAEILGDRAVWAGSAGLARHLAQVWLPAGSDPVPLGAPYVGQGRVVVCVSSLHRVSREQMSHLMRAFGDEVVHHELRPQDLEDAGGLRRSGLAMARESEARIVLLSSHEKVSGADPQRAARTVAGGLAALVRGLLEAGDVDGLVLVGGDGAQATLASLDAEALEVQGQPSEGVPLTRIVGGTADGLAVVTKAGGFGAPTTLTDVVRAMLENKE